MYRKLKKIGIGSELCCCPDFIDRCQLAGSQPVFEQVHAEFHAWTIQCATLSSGSRHPTDRQTIPQCGQAGATETATDTPPVGAFMPCGNIATISYQSVFKPQRCAGHKGSGEARPDETTGCGWVSCPHAGQQMASMRCSMTCTRTSGSP